MQSSGRWSPEPRTLFHWIPLHSDSNFSATSRTQNLWFFCSILAPDNGEKCSYSRAATGSATLLGKVGLDSLRRRVEMNSWFPMHEHTLELIIKKRFCPQHLSLLWQCLKSKLQQFHFVGSSVLRHGITLGTRHGLSPLEVGASCALISGSLGFRGGAAGGGQLSLLRAWVLLTHNYKCQEVEVSRGWVDLTW